MKQQYDSLLADYLQTHSYVGIEIISTSKKFNTIRGNKVCWGKKTSIMTAGIEDLCLTEAAMVNDLINQILFLMREKDAIEERKAFLINLHKNPPSFAHWNADEIDSDVMRYIKPTTRVRPFNFLSPKSVHVAWTNEITFRSLRRSSTSLSTCRKLEIFRAVVDALLVSLSKIKATK